MKITLTNAFQGDVEVPLNLTEIPSSVVLSFYIDIDVDPVSNAPVFTNSYTLDYVSINSVSATGLECQNFINSDLLAAILKDHKAIVVKAVFALYAELISKYEYSRGDLGVEAQLKS
jgi:hypothetical protein